MFTSKKRVIGISTLVVIGVVATIGFGISVNQSKEKERVSALKTSQTVASSEISQTNQPVGTTTSDQLIDAVLSNEPEKVLDLITKQKVDINQANAEGVYPLEASLVLENVEMAELLLQNGANINQKTAAGVTIKDYVNKNCSEVMKKLFKNAEAGNLSISKAEQGATYTVEELYKAIESNNESTVINILESGSVDVNAKTKEGKYPLEAVLLLDNLEMAELLLEKGADPDAVTSDGKTINEEVIADGSKMLKKLFSEY